ncbi:MAG TPA: XdhC family protein, partial [Pedobacter sp.]
GVQLGCNGRVHILFEPIDSSNLQNPIHLLKALMAERSDAVVVTLFNINSFKQPGTVFLYRQNQNSSEFNEPNINLDREAADVFSTGRSIFKTYGPSDGFEAFFEFIPPNIHLVIAGAGNDVQPLVEMAYVLGWKITVLDGRPSHATAARFPKADRVLVLKPDAVFDHVEVDGRTVFVMMTHNYNYDLALLEIILEKEFSYLGMLGPKKKLDRMLGELSERGFVTNDSMLSRVHGPIGLDIGAETAEEIALSILAEIKTVMSDHSAKFLKDKKAPIHVKN